MALNTNVTLKCPNRMIIRTWWCAYRFRRRCMNNENEDRTSICTWWCAYRFRRRCMNNENEEKTFFNIFSKKYV